MNDYEKRFLEGDYAAAVARLSELMDKDPALGSTEDAELELLALVIQSYEKNRFPPSLPDPIDAILFRMDQQRLAQICNQADARIEELEADLETTRATICIMDQTKGYMQARIDELENALRKIADSYCECRADASEIAKKALAQS